MYGLARSQSRDRQILQQISQLLDTALALDVFDESCLVRSSLLNWLSFAASWRCVVVITGVPVQRTRTIGVIELSSLGTSAVQRPRTGLLVSGRRQNQK